MFLLQLKVAWTTGSEMTTLQTIAWAMGVSGKICPKKTLGLTVSNSK